MRELNQYGNLAYVAEYLEKKGILVADDFDVHASCLIESNCTEAIKMRKIIAEAGLQLSDVIKGTEELCKGIIGYIEPFPKPNFPEFSGKAVVKIGGQEIELDLSAELEAQLEHYFKDQLQKFRDSQSRVYALGADLFHNYLSNVEQVRRQRKLPQEGTFAGELLKHNCTVAYGDHRSWLFIFPFKYAPEWLYTRGKRYDLCKEHKEKLKLETGIYNMFQITVERKLMRPKLVFKDLTKFRHYHGSGDSDCWGELKFPKNWTGDLKELAELNYRCEAAEFTINRDSLVNSNPPGLIPVPELLK